MSEDTNLAGLIKEASEKFDSDLTKAREDFRQGIDSLSADQKEKWEKHEAAVGEAAKVLTDLTAKADAEVKHREDLEAKVEELSRLGVRVDGENDAEMLEARIALTQARQEMSGNGVKRIHGDEPDNELATAEDVKALDAAFSRYITGGDKDFSSLEGKIPDHTFEAGSSLFTPAYGIMVPVAMASRIMKELYTYGSLRGLAMLRTGVSGNSAKILRMEGKTTVRVGNEVTDWSAGNIPRAYPTEYPIVDWSSTVSIHRNTLEDASFNVRNFLRQEATMAIGESEANHHINGDGVQKPRGILSASKVDVALTGDTTGEATFGSIKAIKSGADGAVAHATATNAAGGLKPAIAAVNGLHSRYRMSSSWIMSRGAYAQFAMLTDTDGRYFVPMAEQLVKEGGGLSLVQRPVHINDHMPAVANDAYFAMVGDWMQAFEIADKSASMFALVDPFTDKPNIEITLSRRSGASIADTRAIRALKADA